MKCLGAADRGVYFLANDSVYEITVAFLNSFRAWNPDLPLCLIPFDDNAAAIRSLASLYNFAILDDEPLFAKYDNLSVKIHGRLLGHYRKLAAWSGPYNEFIYIDVDTIVLSHFLKLYDLLNSYDFITASSNGPQTDQYVWKTHPVHYLNTDQIMYSANTGFVLSSKYRFTADSIFSAVPQAMELLSFFQLSCMEQAFLNYLIVTSGLPYSSLRMLRLTGNDTNIPQEIWGADVGEQDDQASMESRFGHPILMVHWAGLRHQGSHARNLLWRSYRFR